MRLELEGLPITTYDLQLDPEGVRRGFPLGYAAGGKHFINNHLMMLVLVRIQPMREAPCMQANIWSLQGQAAASETA